MIYQYQNTLAFVQIIFILGCPELHLVDVQLVNSYTQQEHQRILSRTEESKYSYFSFIMEVYEKLLKKYFGVYQRNQEIIIKINTEEKYY